MDIVGSARRVITQTADMTTAAAGAVGGAAINGVIGGVQGTASGVRNGLSSGSHSTPAAALTLGAIGAAGLVEWPLLLAIGGTALVVHQLNTRTDGQGSTDPPVRLQSVTTSGARRNSAARKSASTAQRSRPRKATKTARRTSTKRS